VIVVDSSVWIDFFRNAPTRQVEQLDAMLGREPILVGDLILAEVLQGFRIDADFASARQALESFDVVSMVGPARALRAAENYRRLRRQGVTVRKTVDVLIATYCIHEGHALLYSDRDFDPCVDHLGLLVA